MKENKEILNEAFFKQRKVGRKEALGLPQYEPVDTKSKGGITAYQVTDTDEVKRRLSGTFGVIFGNNNVRSMASRAVKQFPILVSDNVEPETRVMLKRLMEEQYAEYISLMINNQVIDLSAYKAGEEDGNIAIQALDTISGANFRKSKLGTGKSMTDDIFGNSTLYTLLREDNQIAIQTPNESVNALLENALIVPSEDADKVVKYMLENATEIEALLNEDGRDGVPTYDKSRKILIYGMKNNNNAKYANAKDAENKGAIDDALLDTKRGFVGVEGEGEKEREIYTKLTTGDIVLDKKRMDQAINRSVGAILTDPSNVEIRDRFEKATFLLQARRIAGIEYFDYLTLRLGIPVSDKAKSELLKEYKIGDVVGYNRDPRKINKDVLKISKQEVNAIAKNNKLNSILKDICKPKLKDAVGMTAIGAGAGAAAGYAASAAGLTLGASYPAIVAGLITLGPIGLSAIAGAAIGSGAYLIGYLIKKSKFKKLSGTRKIEGWERVESLIEAMDAQQADIRANSVRQAALPGKSEYKPVIDTKTVLDRDVDIESNKKNYLKDVESLSKGREEDSYYDAMASVRSVVGTALREEASEERVAFSKIEKSEALLEEFNNFILEASRELAKDEGLRAQLLTEATLAKVNVFDRSPSPVSVKYVEKKPGADAIALPTSISARTSLAYGSTEIERRENKDRRYDQPLIMTVKFKERFSDGKFADNELTAVIGILGKIIPIPSEEMEYVLKENAEGKTLEGFFKSDLVNNISDMLSMNKVSKDLKGLQKSADIWHNLEKVSLLAAANKMAGRRNNNISNAHIIFAQKELDAVKNLTGIDYLRDAKKSAALMKRYSALTLMVANDAGQRVNIFDDQDNISWNVVPYSALAGKDSGDQLSAALAKLSRLGG